MPGVNIKAIKSRRIHSDTHQQEVKWKSNIHLIPKKKSFEKISNEKYLGLRSKQLEIIEYIQIHTEEVVFMRILDEILASS